MADEVTISGGGGFAPHPEGQFQAVCVDVINLGETVEQFQNNPPRIVPKVAIVFQSQEVNPDTGKRYELSVEKTLMFGTKAGLRDFLGKWRGKSYTDIEADTGVPLHKLDGVNAILTVEHKMSQAGRTYARIANISPIMKSVMKPTAALDYTRSDHWALRKQEYAEKVATHKAATAPKDIGTKAKLEAAVSADDDLPF